MREAVRSGALSSAHDIAEGGLAVALAECCLAGGLGAEVALVEDLAPGATPQAILFGEGAGGFLVSGAEQRLAELAAPSAVRVLGTVGGDALRIERCGEVVAATLAELAEAHAALGQRDSVRTAMAGAAAAEVVSDDRDGPRDECGVFGMYAPGHDVSRLSYFALYALQHRGQESAGIAAADRGGHIITRRELGLVSQVFSENDLRTLAGELAIGHVRYSTTGSNAWENSQPVQRSRGHQRLAPRGRAGAQRQPDQRRRAARRAARARRDVQLHLRLGDHRRDDRHASRRAHRGRDRRRARRACAAPSRSSP